MGWNLGSVGVSSNVRKRRSRAYWACGIAAVLLAGALTFQLFLKPVERRDSLSSIQLARRLPSDLPGWLMKELPLGPNELLERRSAEVLRCDEFVFREFSRRETTFSVFVSYWGQGKMPTRLVSMHTPDRCWIENGWTCPKQVYGARVESEFQRLLPAQWRLFNPPQNREDVFVLFWLMIDGKPYDFGRRLNLVPNPVRWWVDVVEEARSGSKEHMFVRLISNRPFEELRGDPGWEEVLGALAKLGLGAGTPKTDGG